MVVSSLECATGVQDEFTRFHFWNVECDLACLVCVKQTTSRDTLGNVTAVFGSILRARIDRYPSYLSQLQYTSHQTVVLVDNCRAEDTVC